MSRNETIRELAAGAILALLAAILAAFATPAWPAEAQGDSAGTAPLRDSDSEPDVLPTIPVKTSVPEKPLPPPEAEPAQLDELVVFAQKRQQRELDVPISMTVIDDRLIAQQGITDLRDLSLFVPNAKVHLHAVYPDIRIRGFGTNPLNPVFEQSVGLVLDGVPYGSKAFYQGALFDIQQVEVLRGPQGALHGKNTTAGLINVITQAPTDEVSANLDLQSGDLGLRRIEGAVGVPLVRDAINLRVAVLNEQRDGYFANTLTQTSPEAPAQPGARGREALRVRLGFPDLLGSSLQLSYENNQSALKGGYELRRVPEHTRDFFRKFDPNVDFAPDNFLGGFDAPDSADIGVDSVVMQWNRDWGGWGLSAVGGYARLNEFVQADPDGTPAPAVFVQAGRATTLTTLELRATALELDGLLGLPRLFGAALGQTDFIGGVLVQRRKIADLFQTVHLNDQVIGELMQVERSRGSTFPEPIPELPADDEQSTLLFDENAEALALFGQADWRFLPDWSFAAGLRWSQDQKQAHILRRFDTDNTVVFTQVLHWEAFDRQVESAETQVSPKFSLNWQPAPWASLFLSWGNAYKAGGHNAFATGGSDNELSYGPEVVQQWAFDAKLRLSGRGSLNLSVFRMNLDDFQVFTTDPNDFKIRILNAARARSQGVEADLSWLATDWLSVRGALGYNDTEFLEFPFATCPQDMLNSDGDADERCDVSGKPLVRAPKWSGSLTPSLSLPFRDIPLLGRIVPAALGDIGLIATATAEYVGEQYLNDDLDERKKQESFWRYQGGVGVGDMAQTWSFQLSAKNLSNAASAVAVQEVPAVAPGHFYQIPEPGRVVYGHFRWSFY